MKLKVEDGKVVVSLTDEGREDTLVVESAFRHGHGQILPVFTFKGAVDPARARSDTQRVLAAIGETHVAGLDGKLSRRSAAEAGQGRLKQLESLRRLETLGGL